MLRIIHSRIGLSALLTFAGALVACLGVFSTPLAIVGGALAAVGAIWSAIEQNDFEKEITKKNEFIINYITGSDSFCYLQPSGQSIKEDSPYPDYAIVHKGKYPLYDASMIVTDLDEMDIRRQRGELSTKDIEQVPLGTIPPNQVLYNHGELYLNKDAGKRSYNIQFMARNGCWFQNLRFRLMAGKWISATRVVTLDNKELLTNVPSDYPRNDKGDVEW
jgi:hypothetical protein